MNVYGCIYPHSLFHQRLLPRPAKTPSRPTAANDSRRWLNPVVAGRMFARPLPHALTLKELLMTVLVVDAWLGSLSIRNRRD